MRCLSCNAAMTDFEATRKGVNTGQYIDLCNHCFSTVSDDILTEERGDLEEDETIEDEYTYHTDSTDLDSGIDILR